MFANRSQPHRLLVTVLAVVVYAGCAAAMDTPISYLDNGEIRIGADLRIGGAITYLGPSGSDENLINSHDWGRQVQMSFYSGPVPYLPAGQEPAAAWRFLGWNPIQSGDCFGNESKIVDHRNDGETLYVKSIPMQWPLDNVPGKCFFETWITLEGTAAQVRSKITNQREDKTRYPARSQELPAVYTNGPYYRLFTYDGEAPFTGGALRQITKVWDTRQGPQEVAGGPWDHWYATESWAALVNDADYGVGVWSPGTHTFVGGFAGKPGQGGPKDGPTGYIAPTRRETLDHNIEYDYDYVLVVGALEAIREYVYSHADRAGLPDYDFEADRQSWVLREGEEAAWPLEAGWQVKAGEKAARLQGPAAFWDAKAMPVLHVKAVCTGEGGKATVRWERFGKSGTEQYGEVVFALNPDGAVHDYAIDLAASEAYRGPCKRIELRLPAGNEIRLQRVSYRSGKQ